MLFKHILEFSYFLWLPFWQRGNFDENLWEFRKNNWGVNRSYFCARCRRTFSVRGNLRLSRESTFQLWIPTLAFNPVVLAMSDRIGCTWVRCYVRDTAVLTISMSDFTRKMMKSQKTILLRRALLRKGKKCWRTVSNIICMLCILWSRETKKYTG